LRDLSGPRGCAVRLKGMARFLIACGGTGGHFYPGYALGRVLRLRGHETVFALRHEDPAARRLDDEDLPYIELDLRGFPRKPSPAWISYLWRAAGAVRTARDAVRAFRPAAVVGMGGYLTFPAAAGAKLCGVPYVLHESNAMLGLANRVCAFGSARLALGLPLEGGSRGGVLTGTPIREAIRRRSDPGAARRALGMAEGRLTLLVFGGSQGARSLNETAPKALRLFEEKHPGRLQVLHLAGRDRDAEVREAYASAQEKPGDLLAWVRPFMDDMASAYAAADLVLCRSGASTIAELAAQVKPAILVPFPFATGRHQDANARVLASVGAALRLPESEMSGEGLCSALEDLLLAGSGARLSDMEQAYSRLELPDPAKSAGLLADVVEAASKG